MQCIVGLDSLTVILRHHCVAILLAKMLIWASFSQSMCTFSFWINLCGSSTKDIDTTDITPGHPLLVLPTFFFSPTTIPLSNTRLLFTSFLGHQSCVHFFNIVLLIYRCPSYHTCIADCWVSPWKYNTKLEHQPIDLYQSNRACILLVTIKQSIPNDVSFYQDMNFLLAFP